MPSLHIAENVRSKDPDKNESSNVSNLCRSLSPIEALLGSNDSILEAVEKEIFESNTGEMGKYENSVIGRKKNEDRTVKVPFDNCDLSQMMRYDLNSSFSSVEILKNGEEEFISKSLTQEKSSWRSETLFNEALIDTSLRNLNECERLNISIEANQSNKIEEPHQELESQSDCISERLALSTSEEFLFDDTNFGLEEHLEFSIIEKINNINKSIKLEVDKKIDKKIPCELKAETFYGLPERVKTLIHKTKKITCLYDWQDECLNLDAVKNRTNLIYALPTSGGKTLVAEILMLKEIICNKKNVIFILPFVAIVQEKVQALTQFALEFSFLVEEYAGSKGEYPPVKRRRKNSIYVCTIEKSVGLVNSLIECKRLNEIGVVVVDELHLLGENSGRGATLEGLLTKLMFADESIHIIGMSATIGNLKEVAQFLKAEVYTQNFRPIEIKEYVKCENKIWLLNLRADPIFTDEKLINYRYSERAHILDPDRIGGLVMDVVPNDSCLIFCSTRKNCESVALLLTRVMFTSVKDHKLKEKEELLGALKYEGEVCPVLLKTIPFGVAYHHSGLTSEERKLLEDAFKDGTICVLCCTSTLAAGVNLPARRVILRDPYIGNQFINLSRYKQMIGRAGRAGLGEIGESILICKSTEIERVQELLTSRLDDCLSTLHTEEDRGINNLILSSVIFAMAKTRSELHKLVGSTLLGVQEKRLSVDSRSIADKAIANLLKAGVLRIKRSGDFDPNVTVKIPSQLNEEVDVKPKNKKPKRTVILKADTILEATTLGKASMKGCVDLQRAYTLYQDLKIAQSHMVLLNDLHVMYLVTPYDLAEKLKPVGSIYYHTIISLSSSQMMTPRVLGIDEATVVELRDGGIPKGVEPRVINRFWLTLILYELWQHCPLHVVANKYQVNRGIIQNLLTVAATFANSVVRFCQELPEFWAFKDLLNTFSNKLKYCCAVELEPLMELPLVKVGRARQLYSAGFKTLQSIANAKPEDLAKINNLPKTVIKRIIAAANMLLLEKVENLRDEAANVLEGLDVSHFDWD